MNPKRQRVLLCALFWFIPCSTVQNSPKFVCNSAFVCRDCMRVAHRGLCIGVAQSIQADRHRRTDLIQKCGVAMPESMEAALWDAQLL